MPPLFFQGLRSSLLPLLWILQVDLPIFMVHSCSSGIFILFFNLEDIPLPSYFVWLSVCAVSRLLHCCSSGFWCLARGLCGWFERHVQADWWERLEPAQWRVGLGLVPLVYRAADEWGSITALLVVWPEASQHWSLRPIGWGQVLASKWQPLGQLTPMSTLRYFFHQCSCPGSEPQPYPTP